MCNKSVDTLLHGMNHRTVIKWCDSSRRIMKQMMAHYRLCPRNLTSKTCPAPAPIQDDNDNGGGGGNGGITTVFQAVCMAIHCYWPENPQYARVVEPKIESEMRRLLRQLDAEDAIALYALPRAGKGVWWPEYTRGWSQPDWNGEAGGVVTRQCREILGGVELGKPLPAWARDYDDDDYQDECEDDARAGENDLGEDRAVEVDENLYEREDEGQDEDDYQQEQHQTQVSVVKGLLVHLFFIYFLEAVLTKCMVGLISCCCSYIGRSRVRQRPRHHHVNGSARDSDTSKGTKHQ